MVSEQAPFAHQLPNGQTAGSASDMGLPAEGSGTSRTDSIAPNIGNVDAPSIPAVPVSGLEGTPSKKAVKSKAQLKREKRKSKKLAGREESMSDMSDVESVANTPAPKLRVENVAKSDPDTILTTFEVSEDDPAYAEFKKVFERFNASESDSTAQTLTTTEDKGEVMYNDDDDIPSEDSDNEQDQKMSKKKARKMNRLTVAELKQLVKKPDVVEWTDVTAQDPRLLVHLKSYRNTVPVPAHWSQKRDYLSSKRGIEKPPFELPEFIKQTGIAEMRSNVQEKEAAQSLKQKMRSKMQPKMGRLDMDYQKLHDAFFRFQTKPHMTEYGEVYYEGKEFETNLHSKRPGDLSDDLKEALNIPPGAPPPWLINMQRFGPPPSYPSLRIPGLNAPIPSGAQWGFHPGGWGKPPVDEFNRPLWGDVFGVLEKGGKPLDPGEPIERNLFGQLEEVEEDDEEEEEEEEEDGEEEDEEVDGASMAGGLETPSGIATPSGMASAVPSGLETPEFIELRKQRAELEDEEDHSGRSLYAILPEQNQKIRGFMGSQHGYDIAAATGRPPILGQEESRKRKSMDGVNVALDPSALEGGEDLSEEQLRAAYESERARQAVEKHGFQEDLSDMVAEQAAKAARKRQKTVQAGDKKKEKYKF
ncbi:DUF382-domain-containing protein [Saitoella complicata NRRL Y-17804]|uniref:PSP proline-rich domain-containing protein n=1 Tax=Saitoella complicata (strain BCRC 22490 / CBS 7301 / JCM 7358 / NBRC 10748 / NRRL Y-17804) TaxID=698492 RepID=A0A0E9N973_SAICN|nr:DUF382-domain-containing protein [Saitoella complicata NRRL Y-17804]ODQ53147.1 DUF382-domain-containing protein [Saitoella complicata NRRL Y-17804]GAO46271.1 hypothetical protein G7K_0505-t1 [Saitoella complicata NRRL Y-17804]